MNQVSKQSAVNMIWAFEGGSPSGAERNLGSRPPRPAYRQTIPIVFVGGQGSAGQGCSADDIQELCSGSGVGAKISE